MQYPIKKIIILVVIYFIISRNLFWIIISPAVKGWFFLKNIKNKFLIFIRNMVK